VSTDIVINGFKYVIKLVEEWGCNLGEDSFMLEEETVPSTEALSNIHDAAGMVDIHGDMDDLVEDLNVEWVKNVEANDVSFIDADCVPFNFTKNVKVVQDKQAEVVVGHQGPIKCYIAKSSESASKHMGACVVGSCSLKEGKKRASHSLSSSKSKHIKKKKEGVNIKHTTRFVKRIVRLPFSDRK